MLYFRADMREIRFFSIILQSESAIDMKTKIFLGCLMMAAVTIDAVAQSGTQSPYSQFGIGTLTDPSQSLGHALNGTGIGVRVGNEVNTLNPASYSCVDSLTMLFDAGLSGQMTHFKEGGTRKIAKTANFDYVVGSFRAWRNIGVSFGILPLSNVGYSYSSTSSRLGSDFGTLTESYSGEGGLHQAFVGVGAKVLKPLSVGVNVSYLWGSITRSVTTSGGNNVYSLSKAYYATVSSYKLDFGVQWEQPVNKNDLLTIGATVGIGHTLSGDASLNIVNSSTGLRGDTISNAFELPMSYGLGLSYRHGNLLLAADATLQKWGSVKMPADVSSSTNSAIYDTKEGLLKDRTRLSAGVDWTPNPMSRNYLNRMHYRFGVGYATPYYKIRGGDGPKEISATAGFGLPIQNTFNNRSVLNISAQWIHTSATDLITENTFRINIGFTFNERWFMKWKVE